MKLQTAMRSVLVCLILRVIHVAAGGRYYAIGSSPSCGIKHILTATQGDTFTVEYDGRALSEDCSIGFTQSDLFDKGICLKPENFSISQDAGLKVEYHKWMITTRADARFDYNRKATAEWCDSASTVFVMFRPGRFGFPSNAHIKIKAWIMPKYVPPVLGTYQIMGIVIGVLVIVTGCVIAGIYYNRNQRNRERFLRQQQCASTAESTFPLTQQFPQARYQPVGYPHAGLQPQTGYQESTYAAGCQPQTGSPSSSQAWYQPTAPQQRYVRYQQPSAEKVEPSAPPPPYAACI